jgi:hypothetical protein
VLGLIVYVSAAPERANNAKLGLTLLVVAVFWSSWDGVLTRTRPHQYAAALTEGVLLYFGAVVFANLLQLMFGPPSIGW